MNELLGEDMKLAKAGTKRYFSGRRRAEQIRVGKGKGTGTGKGGGHSASRADEELADLRMQALRGNEAEARRNEEMAERERVS